MGGVFFRRRWAARREVVAQRIGNLAAHTLTAGGLTVEPIDVGRAWLALDPRFRSVASTSAPATKYKPASGETSLAAGRYEMAGDRASLALRRRVL